MLREIGYKDRFYYYKTVRNMRIEIILQNPVNPDALKNAVKKSLADYPHFSVRPVLKEGKPYYEEITKDAVVIPEDNKSRYFGTDETNGYLFYLKYQENRFLISTFHGLADYAGLMPFVHNILYYYTVECGGHTPDIRTKTNQGDKLELFDPYAKYADAEVAPTWEYTQKEKIACLSVENEKKQNFHYGMHLSTKQFIDLTHKWKTSFVPALISLISGAMAEAYQISEETVIAYTTVNMRTLFECKNQTNFSEAIVMPVTKELRTKERTIQCKELRAFLDAQRTKQNFSKTMAAVVSAVKKIEQIPDENPCCVSLPIPNYLLTYPGRVEIPEGYETWIKDIRLECALGDISNMGNQVSVVVKTTGDDMCISFQSAVNTEILLEKLVNQLKIFGISARFESLDAIISDLYQIDKLKKSE